MDLNVFLLFAITTFVVVFTPGPAVITVTSQASGNGFWRAQYGIFGIASANALYFALSATGIASILIASHLVFSVIKWIGVAYLVYLGLSAIFSPSGGLVVTPGQAAPRRLLFAKGFVVEFANPKALLYFAAILPQFLDVSRAIAPQIAIMGLTTLALDLAVYSLYALLGQTLTTRGVKGWFVKSLNTSAGGALLFSAFRMAKVGQ